MSRRVHLDNLRASDPTTLDILVQETLRRPIVQVSAATIADIVALAECTALPKSLRPSLQRFADRVGPEIADLPPGEPFESFLAEIEQIPAEKVPAPMRTALANESSNRIDYRARLDAMLAVINEVPPETVVPGTAKTKIQRMKTTTDADNEIADRPRSPRTPKAKSATNADGKPAKVAPIKYVDVDRQKWVTDQLLERLSEYVESGLREDVLLAGLRHRARAEYPDLNPPEILGVLRALQDGGRVKHSAGRWRRVIGSW